MTWIIQPQQLLRNLKWRMTATSDEDGGGPFGNPVCEHDTAEEARTCDACDEYVSRISGFPSRKRMAEDKDRHEREELARLKSKYETKP